MLNNKKYFLIEALDMILHYLSRVVGGTFVVCKLKFSK